MTPHAYHLVQPNCRNTSVVFASPHSGRDYPLSFLRQSVLDEKTIRSSEDAFVDLLFADAPACGAPLLAASAPRAFLDVNRSAEELDPALILGVVKKSNNPRISSGLGVVPRVVANGRAIYRGKLTRDEADHRIRHYWQPYHDALKSLMQENLNRFDEAILIDCHSMPHEAIDSVTHPGGRPDIVLGDRFGAAAAPEIVERIEAAFVAVGLKVVRNAPFAGAYVTQHYGRPSRSQHAIQIEIDRALYMDETTISQRADFDDFQKLMRQVVADIAAIGRSQISLAAE